MATTHHNCRIFLHPTLSIKGQSNSDPGWVIKMKRVTLKGFSSSYQDFQIVFWSFIVSGVAAGPLGKQTALNE